MSFYKQRRFAFLHLDNEIKALLNKGKGGLNISLLLLELTVKFEVSENALRKRIDNWVLSYDTLRLEENKLVVFK